MAKLFDTIWVRALDLSVVLIWFVFALFAVIDQIIATIFAGASVIGLLFVSAIMIKKMYEKLNRKGDLMVSFFALEIYDLMSSSKLMRNEMKAIKIHMMHENGASFIDIGKQFGITGKEAMQEWMKVEKAKERAKNREKVVYRKRLITDHTKLIEAMRGYNA